MRRHWGNCRCSGWIVGYSDKAPKLSQLATEIVNDKVHSRLPAQRHCSSNQPWHESIEIPLRCIRHRFRLWNQSSRNIVGTARYFENSSTSIPRPVGPFRDRHGSIRGKVGYVGNVLSIRCRWARTGVGTSPAPGTTMVWRQSIASADGFGKLSFDVLIISS
jgi:hypothetical protein